LTTTTRDTRALPPLVLACLLATWVVWGSTYLAIKFALVSFPPFFQMGTRFLAAGLVLAAWMRLARSAPWPSAREWRHAAVTGALMLGGGMGGTALAETTVGSGLVVAFIAVVPLVIVLFELAYGLRPTRLQVAGMALGLAGVLMLTQGQGFGASPAGLAAIAVACATWSLGSVLSRHSMPLAAGGMGFASQMLCGGAVLMLLSLLVGERPQWPPEPLAIGAWAYLVVAGSLVAYNAYLVLLARVSTALASSYTFVNPVIALVLGVVVAGEAVSGWEWASAGVVLAGVVLLLASAGRKPAAVAGSSAA
jgi:drug/metabolite transporter (DMT)-like permease